MIKCRNISKSFDDNLLFRNFSYSFKDSGLYILYGVSGSGKTTFLQILLGITSFDEGEIFYDGNMYAQKVVFSDIQDDVAYIAQDAYFIDYLTMEENLLLQTNKKVDKIVEMVEKFNLTGLMKKMPSQLSGGERQRFSLVANILKDKKIFFLDEPTSSIDKKNRNIFYKMLEELANDHLIVCASHDNSIFNLPCEIIDFSKLKSYDIDFLIDDSNDNKINCKRESNVIKEVLKISNYFYKQLFRYEKRLFSIYVFVFVVVFLLLFACTSYKDKVISSLITNHHLKSTLLLCSLESDNYCDDIFTTYSVNEVVYQYNRNLPLNDGGLDGTDLNIEENFEPGILSFPYNLNNMFGMTNILEYGDYYTDLNQIILGYDKAVQLATEKNLSLEQLIGEKINILLPDGVDTFEIVGILSIPDKEQEFFLTATIGQYDFGLYYYLNGKYLEKYLYDDVLGMDEVNDFYQATPLAVFFEDSKSFMKFYYDFIDKDFSNSLIEIIDPVNNFADYEMTDTVIQNICLITSICFLVLGLVIYYQIHKTRLQHTEHNFSIYEYFGYRELSIKLATNFYFTTYLFLVLLISLLFSVFLSKYLNKIIIFYNILPYPLFNISFNWIIIVFVIVVFVSIIESVFLNFSRKKKGWFYLIKEKSDLL